MLEQPGDGAQPSDRGVGELAFRPDPVQEENEDTGQAGTEVGGGIALPHLPVAHDLHAAERGHDEVAVDLLIQAEAVVCDRREPRQPRVFEGMSALDRFERVVGELVVVSIDTDARGRDRILSPAVDEVSVDQRVDRFGHARQFIGRG